MIQGTAAIRVANEKCKVANDLLYKLGARKMEYVEDMMLGIVIYRWTLPNTLRPIVVMATPLWWNVFTEVSNENSVQATLDAIVKLAEPA